MNFTDSEIDKIEKGIKTKFSTQASVVDNVNAGIARKKHKLHTPEFKVADTLAIKDKKYIVTSVETKLLILVIAKDWRKEGYNSPEDTKDDYSKKGLFSEKRINSKVYIGDDNFLIYMNSYEFVPLKSEIQFQEIQIKEIKDKYQENDEHRKIDKQKIKRDETWIKSNPECFTQIMRGIEVSDIKQERRWRQWEKFSGRKIH